MEIGTRTVQISERSPKRNKSGATLTEMLIASLLLGFTLAAIGEVMVVTTLSANKLNNRASGINDIRNATARISADVREASNFGDFYASNYGIILDENDLSSGYLFPGESNPLYKVTDQILTNTQWTPPPYSLDKQTLIIQQPKLFTDPTNDPLSPTYSPVAAQHPLNGMPLRIPPGVEGEKLPNVDTVVYKLIEDPDAPDEYILQRARFVGMNNVSASTHKMMISEPQTVLTGIIGPKPSGNSSGIPEVFSYYGNHSNSPAINIPPATSSIPVNYIRGVGIDLELKKPDSSTGNSNAAYQQKLGIHAEAFLRHNISAKNPYD